MPQVCWQANVSGYYWIDVELARHKCRCMVDLGLVDPLDQIGFAIVPSLYDRLVRAGRLSHFRWRFHNDASGHSLRLQSGMAQAQLLDP